MREGVDHWSLAENSQEKFVRTIGQVQLSVAPQWQAVKGANALHPRWRNHHRRRRRYSLVVLGCIALNAVAMQLPLYSTKPRCVWR